MQATKQCSLWSLITGLSSLLVLAQGQVIDTNALYLRNHTPSLATTLQQHSATATHRLRAVFERPWPGGDE